MRKLVKKYEIKTNHNKIKQSFFFYISNKKFYCCILTLLLFSFKTLFFIFNQNFI